ncbi:MAG: hypothetical protein A2X67_07300 [Ignavibacteria bacterium GWA2_55_11]|nr:MAG: hypothetical protein A2X67_07300 [Ignavibacteria bacterium GWA2_55_11]
MERVFRRGIAVTGHTIDRRDLIFVREIPGIETGVTRNAGKFSVRRALEDGVIDVERNLFSLSVGSQ